MTCTALIRAIEAAGCIVCVEHGRLAIRGKIPANVGSIVGILHSGVRAIFSGRRWCGYRSNDGCPEWLNPAAPLPAGVTRLCVEGDTEWDCLPAAALTDHPELWAAEAEPRRRAA